MSQTTFSWTQVRRECFQVGLALALENPRLSEASQVAGRSLSRLTKKSEWALIYELMGLLGLWVADLPASERYHHSHPFGLLEHSSEVAATLIRDLDARWHSGGGAGILNREERSMWSRVAYVTALLHDVGKVLDVVVCDPRSGAQWDPLLEPLASFKRRLKQEFSASSGFRYRVNRGLNGHEEKGLAVAQVLLAAIPWRGLAPLVLQALSAYVIRNQAPRQEFPVPLGYLILRVHEADMLVTRWGRRRATLDPKDSGNLMKIGGAQWT